MAAAVAVVAVIGALLVAAAGDDDETQVPATTPTTVPAVDAMAWLGEHPFLDPGRYFVDPDDDASTPLRVTYDVTEEGWGSWFGAAGSRHPGPGGASFSITSVFFGSILRYDSAAVIRCSIFGEFIIARCPAPWSLIVKPLG